MIRRLLFLVGGCVAFWLLLGLPARHLGGGDSAVVFIGTALLLCLLPGIATLIWGATALRQSPDRQLILVLGGTGLRMAFVLLAGWALYEWVPYYERQSSFLIWLVVCYLFTLALDMTLLPVGRPGEDNPSALLPRSQALLGNAGREALLPVPHGGEGCEAELHERHSQAELGNE